MGSQLDLDDVAVTSDLALSQLLEMRAEMASLYAEIVNRGDWLVEWKKCEKEIARLRAEAEALQKRNDALVDLSNHVDKLYRDAKAEAEANRVDAERYLNVLKIIVNRFGPCEKECIFSKRIAIQKARAAIDAAMGKDNG